VEGIRLDIREVEQGGDSVRLAEVDQQSVSQIIDAMVGADPQLAWLKEMEQRGDIDWQRVKEVHDSYEYDQQGMGPATAIAVAIAVSAMVGPAAGAIGEMAAIGGGALAAGTSAAAAAGVTAISVQAATSVINNGGDMGAVAKDVFSEDSLKGYATSMLAAGLVSGVVDSNIKGGQSGDVANASKDAATAGSKAANTTKGFDLSTWSGKGGYVLNGLGQAGAQATAQTIVNGGSFQDNLEGALVSQAYSTMQALAFHAVGDFAKENKWADGSPEKIALHATVGGLLSKAMGGDFATGAAAAGANEALTKHLSEGLGLDTNTKRGKELEQAVSQLIGLVGAGLVEGDLQQGSDIAKNATAFNRQLHPSERDLAKRMAEESDGKYTVEQIEEQMRLSSVKGTAIDAATDMVVSSREGIYDDGGSWREVGDSGYMVQKLGEQNPELISYINDKIQIYSWVDNGPKLVMPDWSLAQAVHGRDRLTGYALDENGGYRTSEVVEGVIYNPRFNSCASYECVAIGAGMDLQDSFTQAWLKAQDAKAASDVSFVLGVGAAVTTGGVSTILSYGSTAADLYSAHLNNDIGPMIAGEAIDLAVEAYAKARGASDEVASGVANVLGASGVWDSGLENLKGMFDD
jgi:filamentous hemagglutinin